MDSKSFNFHLSITGASLFNSDLKAIKMVKCQGYICIPWTLCMYSQLSPIMSLLFLVWWLSRDSFLCRAKCGGDSGEIFTIVSKEAVSLQEQAVLKKQLLSQESHVPMLRKCVWSRKEKPVQTGLPTWKCCPALCPGSWFQEKAKKDWLFVEIYWESKCNGDAPPSDQSWNCCSTRPMHT